MKKCNLLGKSLLITDSTDFGTRSEFSILSETLWCSLYDTVDNSIKSRLNNLLKRYTWYSLLGSLWIELKNQSVDMLEKCCEK